MRLSRLIPVLAAAATVAATAFIGVAVQSADGTAAAATLPQRAVATLSCRVMQGTTPEQVQEALAKAIGDEQVKVTIPDHRGQGTPQLQRRGHGQDLARARATCLEGIDVHRERRASEPPLVVEESDRGAHRTPRTFR